MSLSTPTPEDFYDYIDIETENKRPIEEQYRLYHLRKANGEATAREKAEKQTMEARWQLQVAYNDIIYFLDEWIDIPQKVKKFVAIWVIGTYFHEEFSTYPYLFFNAMRGSGKSRLLQIISWLGNKGDGCVQNDMKEADLFRRERNKVLCIDEFENVGSKDKQTLRQLLNSAYKKGLKVTRMKKTYKDKEEKYVAEDFEPYMPICMANIWGMEEVLGDRAITFVIEKSSNPGITKKVEDFSTNDDVKRIKTNLSVVKCSVVTSKHIIKLWNNYINSKYNTTHIHTLHTTTPNYTTTLQIEEREIGDGDFEGLLSFFNRIDEVGIDGRNFELIFPLLLVAKKIHNDIFEEILQISKEIVGDKRKDEFAESKDVSVINFVASKLEYRYEWGNIKDLTRQFREYLGDAIDDEQWLNDKWFGKALKRLCLITKKKRVSSGMQVMLNVDKAKEKSLIFKNCEEDSDNANL